MVQRAYIVQQKNTNILAMRKSVNIADRHPMEAPAYTAQQKNTGMGRAIQSAGGVDQNRPAKGVYTVQRKLMKNEASS